jgi:hypothetical protein
VKARKPAGKTLDEFRAAHDPTHEVDAPSTVFERPLRPGAKVFIITAAQNATPVHAKFWAVLANMAKMRAAELLVIPLRYKNPTSSWSGSQQNAEYWDAAVRPYLWNQRRALNANLTVLGDIKVQPTASSPLTGAEALSLASSGIIGHTKVQTRTIPTPQARMAKLLLTSGACTVQNYTDSRAGKIGEFHHSLSAVLVEIDGGRFHLRRLHYDAKTGSVTDLHLRWTANEVTQAPRALALVMGDTHVDFVDPDVVRATFGPRGIVPTTRPLHLVWHDLLDGYSVNPHHGKNPFNRLAKRETDMDNARKEVQRAIGFVRRHTPADTTSVVVASNHDDFLRRWVVNTDWREDPTNAEFYLETALAMCRGTSLGARGTEYPDPFAYWFRKLADMPNARVLDHDESFTLANVELGYHFDKGPNGARGSIKNMRRLGVKTIGAHSHSPGEDEGATQVGTSTRLSAEYTGGPLSWLNAHCLLNADGKRQMIVVVDGKWRSG